MAFQDVLAAEIEDADTDETNDASTEQTTNRSRRAAHSPFSLEYELDRFGQFETDELNNVLTAIVAVTNLL